jgi:hypothetical protein
MSTILQKVTAVAVFPFAVHGRCLLKKDDSVGERSHLQHLADLDATLYVEGKRSNELKIDEKGELLCPPGKGTGAAIEVECKRTYNSRKHVQHGEWKIKDADNAPSCHDNVRNGVAVC